MRSGTFKYLEAIDSTAYFVITNDSHTEFLENGKYYIKSQITWIGECGYSLKMTAITVPDFPYKPGDTMTVTIDKIEDNIIYYTSDVKGSKWSSRVRKIKN